MPENHYDNTNVIELTASDFSTGDSLRVKRKDFKNNYGIIKFYAPWCPHCVNMKKDMVYLADQLQEFNVKIAAVNCDNKEVGNNRLAAKANIEGLPTIFIFREDGSLRKYNGKRDVEGLLTAIVKTAKKRNS
jgi:thioredoxin-like negative regulator of GroEL